MATKETQARFTPRPCVSEPGETLFRLKGAKELPLPSLHAMNKWKRFLRRSAARLSSSGVNAGASRHDLVKFIGGLDKRFARDNTFLSSRPLPKVLQILAVSV